LKELWLVLVDILLQRGQVVGCEHRSNSVARTGRKQ